jgi:predicted molibdopterin-dependent oxidoreductase YjgC
MDTHNRGYLCVKGRFGHRYLLSKDRLKHPMIKEGSTSNEAEWAEAINITVKRVKEIQKKYGKDAVAVFASPKMSNEELYLLQKLVRSGLKTNNISSLSNLLHGQDLDVLDNVLGLTTSTTTMDELSDSDVIVVVNADLSEENLIMELKIKNAQKKGTKLILINSSEIKLTKFANLWIDSKRGTHTVLLNGIIRELIKNGKIDREFIDKNTKDFSELEKMVSAFSRDKVCHLTGITNNKFEQLIHCLENSKANISFIYNIDSPKEKSPADLQALVNFLLMTNRIGKKGNGLILLRDYANSAGILDMGVTPDYLPGYVKHTEGDEIKRIGDLWNTDLSTVFHPVDLKAKMLAKEIKAVLIFGEDPLDENDNWKYFNEVEFLMVSEMFPTATVREADVVLPAASYIEQDGTFTACDRRIQKVNKLMPPKSGMENWQIILNLAQGFGKDFRINSVSEITKEIHAVNRFCNHTEPDQFWGGQLFQDGFYTEDKKARFSTYDVDITTQNPQKPRILFSENYFKVKIKRHLMI